MQLREKKYCRVCDSVIIGKLGVGNNETLCSEKCGDEFKDYTQEYDISSLIK